MKERNSVFWVLSQIKSESKIISPLGVGGIKKAPFGGLYKLFAYKEELYTYLIDHSPFTVLNKQGRESND